jgi:hypothetical protein
LVQTPLNASANTAGTLLSSNVFEVPQFQREYSWLEDQVEDFWSDFRNNLASDTYFLGLIILTDEEERKYVVDGQQRLITLSLMAAALYHEAAARGRGALADRISANFLKSIDYETDEIQPRVRLSDKADDATFQQIIDKGVAPSKLFGGDSVSDRIVRSYEYLQKSLREDLKTESFKRLGSWTDFLTHRVYFAVFIHPDPSSAYQVYEVINTRGKELTTADLLKNHVLSKTSPRDRQQRYERWQSIASQFSSEGTNNFVQYIRHVITVENGHVLPKDLFSFLAGRMRNQSGPPHSAGELMVLLEESVPLYTQMIDPSLAGPAGDDMLAIFGALNSLGVLAVRPILLAIYNTDNPVEGMEYVLKLVVRRIIVGNLGTGNVERRLGEAAENIHKRGTWRDLPRDLRDLNPSREDFEDQLRKRSFNKSVLTFIRRSVVQRTTTPQDEGFLHLICPRQAEEWQGMDEEDRAFWSSTLGNAYLSQLGRRPNNTNTWMGFRENVIGTGVNGEIDGRLLTIERWDAPAVERVGREMARAAGAVWYE